MLSVGSLFSGVGGFDLGFEQAGMETAWQVEIDRHCNAVCARHYPHVLRRGDVRDAGKRNLPPVDLVCGGFPCQDLSVAGKRAGLAGKRSGLWFEFYRVVRELEPEWVVIENVAGLLSSHGGADFAAILRGLVECGYGVCWRVFDSQGFGVPQRRRRVFVVGHLGDGRAAEVLFEREGSSWNFEAGQKPGAKIAGALTVGAHPGGFNGRDVEQENHLVIAHALTSSLGGGFRYDPNGEDYIVFNWQSGGDVRLGISDQNASAISATQTQAVVRQGIRRLMPIECERLQGFPDDWTKYGLIDGELVEIADTHRYRMMGNAVTVSVVRWIGERIVAACG